MRNGRIGAGNQQAVGEGDVLVAAGWGIGPERLLVAGDRRGHAQARVGVDVVGADQTLGQLVEHIVVFGQQLPGNVEGNAVRPMRGDDFGKAVGGMIEGRIPADALSRLSALPTQFGMQQAVIRTRRQMQSGALGAQTTEVGRMLGIATHTDDPVAFTFDHLTSWLMSLAPACA
jgi:hypothetical protein